MWTQYSREQPARVGWTIATMAIALAGTIGIAQLQVNSRREMVWKEAQRVELSGWAYTFGLPDLGAEWSLERNRIQPPRSIDDVIAQFTHGSGKHAVYSTRAAEDKDVTVVLQYQYVSQDALHSAIQDMIGDSDDVTRDDVMIGPLEAVQLTKANQSAGGSQSLCVGIDTAEEAMIFVTVQGNLRRRTINELARWISESMRRADR